MNTVYDNAVNYPVAEASPEMRASFVRKTYIHLALAILAFIAIEAGLIVSGVAYSIAKVLTGGWTWLLVLGAFMGVSILANWWAHSQTSKAMQYAGLGLYVVAEAIIFAPLLYIAASVTGGGVILEAGVITLALFGGLTAVVILSGKNFSFLGPILMIGGFLAMGLIVASIAFGFSLGLVFSWVMVAFAAGSILYNTSNVMHEYNPTQHVAASLSLFASVALLFWYVIRIFLLSRD